MKSSSLNEHHYNSQYCYLNISIWENLVKSNVCLHMKNSYVALMLWGMSTLCSFDLICFLRGLEALLVRSTSLPLHLPFYFTLILWILFFCFFFAYSPILPPYRSSSCRPRPWMGGQSWLSQPPLLILTRRSKLLIPWFGMDLSSKRLNPLILWKNWMRSPKSKSWLPKLGFKISNWQIGAYYVNSCAYDPPHE